MSNIVTIFFTVVLSLLLFTIVEADLIASSTILTSQTVSIELAIDTDTSVVQITMVGPATRWWGIGFGGTTMSGRYAIIADSDDSSVTEYTLGNHNRGSALSSSQITICSDSVVSSTRTILLTRALDVSDGYDFSDTAGSLSMIAAYGASSTTYANAAGMAARTSTSVEVTESPSSVTICTSMPTVYPSMMPTSMPTVYPSMMPTSMPTVNPSMMPIMPTLYPSKMPTSMPIVYPTVIPTSLPTVNPSMIPSSQTSNPTVHPSVVTVDTSSVIRYGYQQWIICCLSVITFALYWF